MSRESRALALVVLAAAAMALVSACPYAGAWNDGSRLATVECLIDRGTLVIDDSIFVAVPAGATPYRGPALLNGTLDKLLINEHFYSDKSPVPALLLALVYQLLQWLFGLRAALHPEAFCYLMTVASSGAAYVVAVACVFQFGKPLKLTLGWRLLVTASFALATVALVYVRHVNNHELLLGVAAALVLQLARLADSVARWRVALAGTLAALGYTIDLGAGPPLLLGSGLVVVWLCGRRAVWFALGALPWLALHHGVNYAVGGTFGPANAVPEYFNWEGCPFHGGAMTGSWHHESVWDFLVYSLALLFGKRGFVGHNLPLFLLLPGTVALVRRPPREWPVLAFAALWAGGTWLLYAATSRNYSGANCTVRWFVPLLAPAFFALAVLLRDDSRRRVDFLILSGWGLVLTAVAWCNGPWITHLVPGLWPIEAAALASWGWYSWRRAQPNPPVPGYVCTAARVRAGQASPRRHAVQINRDVLEGDPA